MLVDSSVWIDWLRNRDTPATRLLERLLDEGEARLAPVIIQEILQGARSPDAFNELKKRFTGQPMLVTDSDTYIVSGRKLAIFEGL
ncbi:MAG: hypothetical protein KZQ58_11640 [gamma proteobacterium symbiont of Bathyaustriella thionipta]|nr:hypothetical protein [gamma proteobacterium symbiont of Bathyaustriella thionipta]